MEKDENKRVKNKPKTPGLPNARWAVAYSTTSLSFEQVGSKERPVENGSFYQAVTLHSASNNSTTIHVSRSQKKLLNTDSNSHWVIWTALNSNYSDRNFKFTKLVINLTQ